MPPDEVPVLRLVTERPHAQQSSDAAAQQGQQEQRLFRYAPHAPLGAALVDTVHREGGQVDDDEPQGQYTGGGGQEFLHRQSALRSLLSSTAVAVARRALLYTSWMLAARLLPPVMSLILASRKGVVALPWMP